MNMPEYLNASYEADDLFTGDQLRKAVLEEREACAKVCETLWKQTAGGMETEYEAYGDECAKAILARGEQK